MFLKTLKITNDVGIIRNIKFHSGLNLIVDETSPDGDVHTGNNVGKTSVLMLIDFCLGAAAKGIYTDPENRKNEYSVVKDFLINTSVLITLTLTDDLSDLNSRELVIERNFLPKKHNIRKINGEQKTEVEFEEALVNSLFPGHFGKKPTFRQIISHNIRYKDLSINNTLKTLDVFTRDDEYETLYLFLLGCHFEHGDQKQNLVAQMRVETTFKTRLEALQTRSAYETALSLLSEEIATLNAKKSTFNVNADFEQDLQKLDSVKYSINSTTFTLNKLRLRRQLIQEATREISADRSAVDLNQLRTLYDQVSSNISSIHKTFEQLLDFHNRMVEEKARYIAKDLPRLSNEIAIHESELQIMLSNEALLANKIARSDSFEGLEALIIDLNEKHRRMGEYQTIIQQITDVDATLKGLNDSLADIDDALFSAEFEETIKTQLNKFNRYFSAISQEIYGERYALKVDLVTNKAGQRIYKFTAFNLNFSSGKKQGEISCFDIAYVQFADNEGIPCYHFLLNDKKELMHDNQLIKISQFVMRDNVNVQFVASILKDKLPAELNDEKYFVVKLSQNDKLFRIERLSPK